MYVSYARDRMREKEWVREDVPEVCRYVYTLCEVCLIVPGCL